MPHLVIETGTEKGKRIPLRPDGEVTFGRDTSCGYQVMDLSASRTHFKVIGAGGAYVLQDQESRNGTFLNEDRVKETTLNAGDLIRVGDTIFQFEVQDEEPAPAAGAGAPVRRLPRDPLEGTTVGGYQIHEMIGRGGMGAVFRATQVSLGRMVALKILSRRYTRDEKFIEMFVREARSAGALNHPNIVQVYDVGREGDLHYYSMEHMSRGTVGDMLKELGTISVPRALTILLHAAKGLEYAEKKGIIHCDIKPDNLMLNEEGTVKIVDLGLSRTTIGEVGEGGDDVALGTPHFVSPEQAQRKKLDHRADQYSLGATFFLMLTGYPVFLGDTAREIVTKHIKEPPPQAKDLNPAIPDTVSRIIDRMLKKNPEERFPSATALLEELKRVNIEVNPQAAYTDGFPGIPSSEGSRPTGLIVLGVAAVLVILASLFLFPLLFGGEEPPGPGPGPGPENTAGGGTGEGPGPEDEAERLRWEEEQRKLEEQKQELAAKQRQFREEEAGQDLKAVIEFEKQQGLTGHLSPQVLQKYEALARKYPDTDAGKTALARAEEMRAKQEAHKALLETYEGEKKAAEDRARERLKEQRFGEAQKAFEAFDVKRFEDMDAGVWVKERVRAVLERAKDAWVLGETKAKSDERQGRFEEAAAFYESVTATWGIPEYTALAKVEAARLVEAAKATRAAAAKALLEEDRRQLAKAERAAQDLAEKGFRFLAAREEFRRLVEGTPPLLQAEKARAEAREFEADFDLLVALKNRLVAEASKRAGKVRIKRRGKDVTVMGASLDALEISMGAAQTSVKWEDFTAKEFHEAAGRILDPLTPADHLRLGTFAMVTGLVNEVLDELNLAVRDGDAETSREAQKYIRRFHDGYGKAGRQLEDQAQCLYAEIAELYRKAEAEGDHNKAIGLLREALEKLNALEKEYGKTRFVREKTG